MSGRHEAALAMRAPKSGDRCRFVKHPDPTREYPAVEHYQCDDHRDFTVTDPANGKILKSAPPGSPIGFDR